MLIIINTVFFANVSLEAVAIILVAFCALLHLHDL